ncbi:MAG TPA: sulfatase [bacterium]|nr:sulfatase [bacterium]
MKHPTCNRRQALRTMAAGAAAGAALPLLGSGAAGARPNIIFILTDDHRWDAFGFMDKPWLKTPNMDRIAREGVHFKNSFVTTSLCSPSRASFLTGQYARCHGVVNNLTPWNKKNVTFLELLHGQGYNTAFIGKWHMPGKTVPDLVGEGKLDRMVSFSIGLGQGVYEDCPLVVDGKDVKSSGYLTDILTSYALEFLDRPRPGPFCLYLSHKAVHNNFIPPERYRGKLAGAPLHPMEEQTRAYLMSGILVPQLIHFQKGQQRYYEALMGVDDSVGAVLKLLDDKRWAENTLIVYGSDNGYLWGEHGLIDKRLAYEESIRVPHLLRWPRLAPEGGIKAGQMVLNIDLNPTLLTAAGIPVPGWVQGRSYLEFLDPARHLPGRGSWLYEYREDPGFPPASNIKAVRTRDWKLITYPGAAGPVFKDELYHLADDPGERNDLADDPARARKKNELAAELARLDRELTCQSG